MTTPCVLTLEGVDIPVWEAEFTQVVINAGGGAGGPAAWGNITGTLSAQVDLSAALAGKLSAASNLGDLPNAAAARTNLGLGSAAQSAASSFATASQGVKADTALQPGAGLSAIDSAAASKLAGVQAGATANSADAQLRDRATHTGTQPAATISGLPQAIGGILQAGSNVTITPSGSQLVISSAGGGGGGSTTWGGITGTLGDQADLAAALNAKANTSALAPVATAGTYASLTGKPILGTAAASNVGDFATAAQGVKADSAVQPAGLAPYAKTADLPAVPTKTSELTNDSGFVSASTPVIASEPLTAGDWVSLWDSGGDARVRKSDHASLDKEVDGYVLVGVASGAVAEVFTSGMNTAVAGQQLGPVFAAAAGSGSASVGAGAAFAQRIGTAIRPDAVVFSRGPAVGL